MLIPALVPTVGNSEARALAIALCVMLNNPTYLTYLKQRKKQKAAFNKCSSGLEAEVLLAEYFQTCSNES